MRGQCGTVRSLDALHMQAINYMVAGGKEERSAKV